MRANEENFKEITQEKEKQKEFFEE